MIYCIKIKEIFSFFSIRLYNRNIIKLHIVSAYGGDSQNDFQTQCKHRKKSVVFILIIVLTVFLSIGAGMYESARNLMKEADKTASRYAVRQEAQYLPEPFLTPMEW